MFPVDLKSSFLYDSGSLTKRLFEFRHHYQQWQGMGMDFHTSETIQDELPLLRPLRLLALGAKEPDWNFLQARLERQEWELKQVVWNRDLLQTHQNLRTEHWDCLVISLFDDEDQFSQKELDSFLAAIRESGLSIAVLGLASSLDVELAEMFQKYQCDFHEIRAGWFSPVTASLIQRTMHLQQIALENQKLRNKENQRSRREQEEAEVILGQQRSLLQEILKEQNSIAQNNLQDESSSQMQNEIADLLQNNHSADPRYEQTLRSFVIMGAGRLENELSQLAGELQAEGNTPRELLAMHLGCLERLVEGLGYRSSRHVIQRADQMLLEMMVHLADNYRCKVA